MLKDNKLAILNAYNFFKRNSSLLLALIILISVVSSINIFLGYILLMLLVGSIIFYIRDNELLEDIRRKKLLTINNLKRYIKYGFFFSILYIFFQIVISVLVLFTAVIITILFYSGASKDGFTSFDLGLTFLFSLILASIIIFIILSPFYFLLPVYINLILSSAYPLEILKVNIKLFSKNFWVGVLSLVKIKYFVITTLFWTILSILIFVLAVIVSYILDRILTLILGYIPIPFYISYKLTALVETFIIFSTIVFLFVYLVYISHYIKLKTG